MSNAVVGALRVTLGLDSAAFTNGLSGAQRQLQQAGQRMQAVGRQMAGIGAGLSVAVTAPLVALGRSSMQAANQMNEAMAQIDATLTATGGTVGRTSEELRTMARELQRVSTYDDGDILQNVTNNLLRFTNVSGEAFDRAQQLALDYAAKTGKSLSDASTLIGRALNDPIRGLSLLTRAGIELGDEQEALVRQMMAVGDVAGAQDVILTRLNGVYENSAQVARDAAPGSSLIDAWRDLQDTIGQLVVSVMGPLTDALAGILERFNELSPATKRTAIIFAAVAAAVGPVLVVMGGLVASIGALLPVLGTVGAAMAALPLAPLIAGVAAAVAAFMLFKDDIIPAVQTFGRAVAEELGPKLRPLLEAVMGAVRLVGDVFSAIFGGSGSSTADLTGWGQLVGRIFGAALDIITGAIEVVTSVLRALGALLRGDFSAMWGYLGQAVASVVTGIGRAFQTLFPEVSAWVRRTYEAVREWLLGRFEAVVRGVGNAVGRVTGFFRDLYIAVVGNSYIPDMVEAIAEWMGPRLQAAMVDPARAAAEETEDAFRNAATAIEDRMESLARSLARKDWKGALRGLAEVFTNTFSASPGALGGFARFGASILKGLPGFQTGGSFRVGGAGAADSQLVAFRASPGERVDISTRSQQRDMGGGVAVIRIDKSPYFDAEVERVSAPVAQAAAGSMAGQIGAHQADAQRRAMYRTRGGR